MIDIMRYLFEKKDKIKTPTSDPVIVSNNGYFVIIDSWETYFNQRLDAAKTEKEVDSVYEMWANHINNYG